MTTEHIHEQQMKQKSAIITMFVPYFIIEQHNRLVLLQANTQATRVVVNKGDNEGKQ